jgi:hypothetical protein
MSAPNLSPARSTKPINSQRHLSRPFIHLQTCQQADVTRRNVLVGNTACSVCSREFRPLACELLPRSLFIPYAMFQRLTDRQPTWRRHRACNSAQYRTSAQCRPPRQPAANSRMIIEIEIGIMASCSLLVLSHGKGVLPALRSIHYLSWPLPVYAKTDKRRKSLSDFA